MPFTPFIYVVIGMPYPQNLETAKEVEAIVTQNGAKPATIAILDGVPCIGRCSVHDLFLPFSLQRLCFLFVFRFNIEIVTLSFYIQN